MGYQTVTDEQLRSALRPFDVVSLKDGSVGFVQEVSINDNPAYSGYPDTQISYAITTICGSNTKHAWFKRSELARHCNLMVKIAENMVHPFGSAEEGVGVLFSKGV